MKIKQKGCRQVIFIAKIELRNVYALIELEKLNTETNAFTFGKCFPECEGDFFV